VVEGVLEGRADHVAGGVVEFDAEDHLGCKRIAQLIERRPGSEQVPGIYQQADRGMIRGRNDLGSHRNGGDDREGHRLDGHSGPAIRCLIGKLPQRGDQRFRMRCARP
jgi:hypothetical protein